jgi:mRNA interferase RelE/StbE
MSYQIILTSAAERELDAQRGEMASLLQQAIDGLETNPRPHGCTKLAILHEWRVRVRDYRIRYRINDEAQIVTITHVVHRDKAN